MLRLLSLAHLTFLRLRAPELIDVAFEAGFDAVGLRLMSPPADGAPDAMDAPTLTADALERLDETGLAVLDVEVLWVQPTMPSPDRFERFFDVAASLGAHNAVAMVHDDDETRAVESFSRLCALAAPRDISINLELARYSAVKSLEEASVFLEKVAAPNARVLIDTLHFFRADGEVADLAQPRVRLAPYIQLSDAPAAPPSDVAFYRDEARSNRLDPGEGELPLAELLDTLPPNTTLSLEVPQQRFDGMDPRERAQHLIVATKRLLEG
jgi:sugar phosphate isomerase/epimerase